MTPDLHLSAPCAHPCEIRAAVVRVAGIVGEPIAWMHRGRFHFRLDGTLTVAIRPESARRLRVELCEATRPRATFWTSIDDDARLAQLVVDLAAFAAHN